MWPWTCFSAFQTWQVAVAADRRKQVEDQDTDDSSLQDKPGFYILPMLHGLEGPAWPCKHWFDGEALKFAGRVIAVRRVRPVIPHLLKVAWPASCRCGGVSRLNGILQAIGHMQCKDHLRWVSRGPMEGDPSRITRPQHQHLVSQENSQIDPIPAKWPLDCAAAQRIHTHI